ncbi:VIT1/CCC1 transporter family protein [Halioxenophilus aromaticivorans]|uniref:VIT family protein n=1 Tax=Halioxenophilus aromaticivorans TaxID=1306992 RepID=A0AAV3U233_9ALTE
MPHERPLLAAGSSAALFTLGAGLPLLCALLAPANAETLWVAVASVASLVLLGWLSAKVGGARVLPAMSRVAFWGVAAMVITAVVGMFVGPGG